MKILIVEDDREAADYLEKAFAEAGHTAHVARDGETGFALADSGDYDVMVVDRMLPRRDGLSLIAGLRSRGNTTRRRLPDQAIRLFRASRPRRGAEPPCQLEGGRDGLPCW